ncbi:hypothetical protein [Legionella sp. W05-934-2]|jgi:hypothetical protein|uniref:hypothetical protein n=1 Tax=Legionella sp. W05-934-2 TaxID=1198649 RepID=UPI003461A84A
MLKPIISLCTSCSYWLLLGACKIFLTGMAIIIIMELSKAVLLSMNCNPDYASAICISAMNAPHFFKKLKDLVQTHPKTQENSNSLLPI